MNFIMYHVKNSGNFANFDGLLSRWIINNFNYWLIFRGNKGGL